MKIAISGLALVLTASFASAAAPSGLETDVAKFHGSYARDYATGALVNAFPNRENDVIVYDNLNPPSVAQAGFTSLNTTLPTYGDDMTLASGGRLQELYFTLFNSTSSGNTGSIIAGTMNFKFYDALTFTGAATSIPVGQFTATLDYSADPIPAGFYTTDGVVGLNALNIVLPQDVLITQTFTQTLGTSTVNGFVSLNPINVGTSAADFYMNRVGNPEGFYTLNPAGSQTNLGYLVVVPEPTSIAALSLGGLVLRRRRA
jgi:hypothetical protein